MLQRIVAILLFLVDRLLGVYAVVSPVGTGEFNASDPSCGVGACYVTLTECGQTLIGYIQVTEQLERFIHTLILPALNQA